MTDYIAGKISPEYTSEELLSDVKYPTHTGLPLVFSDEAKQVFDSGRELWKYYHNSEDSNPNSSFYDIREHFQGRNKAGRMNSKSTDEKYTKLIKQLRDNLKLLAKKIEPKIYEYEFLIK